MILNPSLSDLSDPVKITIAAKSQPLSLEISHKISAGFPSPAADYTTQPLDINQYLIHHPTSSYFFTVEGYSMKDIGILPGDKVIADRALEAHHGDIVIAVVDNTFTIKRLYQQRQKIALLPENKDFSPITFKEGEELQIWGVIVGVIRKIHP